MQINIAGALNTKIYAHTSVSVRTHSQVHIKKWTEGAKDNMSNCLTGEWRVGKGFSLDTEWWWWQRYRLVAVGCLRRYKNYKTSLTMNRLRVVWIYFLLFFQDWRRSAPKYNISISMCWSSCNFFLAFVIPAHFNWFFVAFYYGTRF